jgi:hypothetical protein
MSATVLLRFRAGGGRSRDTAARGVARCRASRRACLRGIVRRAAASEAGRGENGEHAHRPFDQPESRARHEPHDDSIVRAARPPLVQRARLLVVLVLLLGRGERPGRGLICKAGVQREGEATGRPLWTWKGLQPVWLFPRLMVVAVIRREAHIAIDPTPAGKRATATRRSGRVMATAAPHRWEPR